MPDFLDHYWQGTPGAMHAALAGLTDAETPPGEGRVLGVLGPVTMDEDSEFERAYVAIRADAEIPKPSNLALAGPQLARRIVGVWADPNPEPEPS